MADTASKRPLIIAIALLVVGGGIAAFFLLRGGGGDPVMFVNGFDFAVTANLTSESGDKSTLLVPSKGRIRTDITGTYTVEFVAPDGQVMKTKKFKFKPRDQRKKRCLEIVNVLGSAAILEEDVVFGVGFKGRGSMTSGSHFVRMCPRWGFGETPPKAISTSEKSVGMTLKWMHYMGDGDWVAAIDSLLAKKPQMGDQSRIKAWNIAFQVNKFDSKNPRLKPLGPKFKKACHSIVDMFTTGPLAGKAKKDCLRNTKAMFPDA